MLSITLFHTCTFPSSYSRKFLFSHRPIFHLPSPYRSRLVAGDATGFVRGPQLRINRLITGRRQELPPVVSAHNPALYNEVE